MSGQAPSAETIEQMARAALARIPEPFAGYLADVVLIVDELADDATLDSLDMDDPYQLTGLYTGPSLREKSSMDSGMLPNRIHLYRQAILFEWIETGIDLEALVNIVVVHEVGHHFGLSDDDIDALEKAVG